jgi:hypothetical protein
MQAKNAYNPALPEMRSFMKDLLLALSDCLLARRDDLSVRPQPLAGRSTCDCANGVCFADTHSGDCGARLEHLAGEGRPATLHEAYAPGIWPAEGRPDAFRLCASKANAAVCNQMDAASWRETILLLNEMARSAGKSDDYPLVLSTPAEAKLRFVQMVVSDARALPAP